jgi:hypothetical protein
MGLPCPRLWPVLRPKPAISEMSSDSEYSMRYHHIDSSVIVSYTIHRTPRLRLLWNQDTCLADNPCQLVMKQDLKPRFSLRAFFATLLRPLFMSESPTDVSGLLISVEGRTDVTPWQTLLMSTCLSLQCRLKHVYCDNNKQHEFLLLHFRHRNSSGSAVATMMIERIPKQDPRNNSSPKLIFIHTSDSKSPSPSAPETAAQDVVYTSSQGSPSPQYLADFYAPLIELRVLDFPLACPSAAQISILLSVVNRQAQTTTYTRTDAIGYYRAPYGRL